MYIFLIILVILFFASTLTLSYCLYRAYQNYVQLLNEITMLKQIIEWYEDNYNPSEGGSQNEN